MGKLYAIADLHLSFPLNKEELKKLYPHPEDSIILAGDIGDTLDQLQVAFAIIRPLFDKVWWCPGNHELYSLPTRRATLRMKPEIESDEKSKSAEPLRGEAKYLACVALCRQFHILTPEDPFETWDRSAIICPIFTLYDYSFRPDDVSRENVLDWAIEEGIMATDEALLHPDPFATRDEWCESLCKRFERKLELAAEKARKEGLKLVIINHWPLKESLAYLPRVPRFKIWCGTKLTEDWGSRFNAAVVVSGHCHLRRTDWIDGTRFEECSLGYPAQWKDAREHGCDANDILREILPGPQVVPEHGSKACVWRRYG